MLKELAPLPDPFKKHVVTADSFCYPEDKFFKAYQALSQKRAYHILLESGQSGRYSIAGFTPFAVLRGKNNRLFVKTQEEETHIYGDPLQAMKEWLSPYKVVTQPDLPDFQTGVIGFLSYDYIRYIEEMPFAASDDLETDDLYFLAFQEVFVYDHLEKRLWIVVHSDDEEQVGTAINRWKHAWEFPPVFSWDEQITKRGTCVSRGGNDTASFTEETFSKAVNKVQDYIRAGDVFQVNLSVRQKRPLKTPPLHVYEKLRTLNPSPYMGYMHTPDLQVVSASPELLIKKRGNKASTRPIAGTRARGTTETEDIALERELIGTEKERAEHVMLVDLERNDLGKVCMYGSVSVDELMVIERYSHVMHIVSNVKGKLFADVDEYDMIKAAFPGGTITGAPKIRTMEIIEELEPVRRGIYTGSVGWLGFNGDLELNIAIRTMVVKEDTAYVQAGAGIVIDSNPQAEYQESLKKARALWKAQEISEEELVQKHSRAEEEKA
ncbi:aminodeoxychorismate synthase, subunit I [Alteribacillus persepolensis]|uniref:Aminodeoxychorismate synthase, subunit I n=1 Tax=Alteribacillus persepolensis TaxID=568899 RepID=A0A1G8I1G5_9BACI|nr:anthranilate synthase component I family protein [Alteribacillus persepolensis]SDI12723.1 aminodeoxychorismate synthase, subunit I [Alteribacillus persepolensis]